MGERFLAFLCDASVWTALAACFLVVYFSRSSLDFEGLKAPWTNHAEHQPASRFAEYMPNAFAQMVAQAPEKLTG